MDKIKRFTSKYPDSTPVYHKYYLNGYHYEQGDHIDKLGQIEDNEEELGISLDILFKALKNGVYYDSGNKIIKFHRGHGLEYINFNVGNKRINLMYINPYGNEHYCEMALDLSDYGKTWALTKEELENYE